MIIDKTPPGMNGNTLARRRGLMGLPGGGDGGGMAQVGSVNTGDIDPETEMATWCDFGWVPPTRGFACFVSSIKGLASGSCLMSRVSC